MDHTRLTHFIGWKLYYFEYASSVESRCILNSFGLQFNLGGGDR